MRISIDTKAVVHVGQYSRGGRSRGLVAVKALDHDRYTKLKRVPGGILEPVTGQAFVFLGTSHKTSDFMADGLQLGWRQRGQQLQGIKQLVINLDNGAECNGRRSQFLHRMTQFADTTGLCVRLVYYPPYHSKYNAIERYWAGLEQAWNGYLLDTVSAVLNRVGQHCWRGARTLVELIDTAYEKGVKLCSTEKTTLEQRLLRSVELRWWDVTIQPNVVLL